MTRAVAWTLGIVLLAGACPWSGRGCDPPRVNVIPFDSGTRVVREVAEALTEQGRSILEAYPRGSGIFLGLVSLLPEACRIAAIEWGMRRSLGHPADRAADVSVDALAEWCVAQYPGSQRYSAVVLGSPNGAVAHLAALLAALFLTTSFGLTFRHPAIGPDDLAAYRDTSLAAAEKIIAGNPGCGYEVVCHYDPLHDRLMVQAADFVRIKLRDLPAAYRAFLRDRLAPGGALVLVDCTYSWPQIALGERIFLQLGGLGAVDPKEYLDRWAPESVTVERRESEWGCPEPFAEAVSAYAADRGLQLIGITRNHPADYSLLALDAYKACDGVRCDAVLIDTFNHVNPRTNLATGIPGLWLPFNTADGLDLVKRALYGRMFETIYIAPLPSFSRSPDTVTLDGWIEHLAPYGNVEWIGIRPDKYPADPLAPYRFARDTAALRTAHRSEEPLRLPIERLRMLLPGLP